jgi:hypothetical protein
MRPAGVFKRLQAGLAGLPDRVAKVLVILLKLRFNGQGQVDGDGVAAILDTGRGGRDARQQTVVPEQRIKPGEGRHNAFLLPMLGQRLPGAAGEIRILCAHGAGVAIDGSYIVIARRPVDRRQQVRPNEGVILLLVHEGPRGAGLSEARQTMVRRRVINVVFYTIQHRVPPAGGCGRK